MYVCMCVPALKSLNEVHDTFLKNALLFYARKNKRRLYRHGYFLLQPMQASCEALLDVFSMRKTRPIRAKKTLCAHTL